jgi:hypothetical protein
MQLDIDAEVATLQEMSTGELAKRYAEVFGEQAGSRHKAYLIRRIAWRMQALAEGDLSERARQRAKELANDADVRVTPPKSHPVAKASRSGPCVNASVASDSRLPVPGGAIVRKYKGRQIRVVVRKDGFELDGQRYKSLSGVAKAITGSHCNGFRLFGLEGNS